MPTSDRRKLLLLGALLVAAVLCTYRNHFDNAFQFDDAHTIQQNVWIRDLANLPRFFTDARTFSVHPPSQLYRPVLVTTLAIDYRLAGGLKPFLFHLSTFLWFLLQLGLMVRLYRGVMDRASPAAGNTWVALFGVAWYGLHPVSAETVNYIIQRGDLLATLGVIAGLVLYAARPRLRRFGLYLLPVLAGALAKPSAIMFAPLLFVYVLFFEEDTSLAIGDRSFRWDGAARALRASLPAFILCAAVYLLSVKMTSPTWSPGGDSLFEYVITQPWVQLHYLRSLVLPTALSADSDWQPLRSILDPRAVAGFVFVLLLAAAAVHTSRRAAWRPVSFGIAWWFLAHVPTTFVPYAEVMNDHRMFFPFVGAILSVCWGVALLQRSLAKRRRPAARRVRRAIPIAAVALLPLYAFAAYARNAVWRTPESLWRDVTIQSPGNARGLTNYALTQMDKGNHALALEYLERARVITPNNSALEASLGVCTGALGRAAEAEQHFRRAIALAPELARPHIYYAQWLNGQDRAAEATAHLDTAIRIVPSDLEARYLLMEISFVNGEWQRAREVLRQTLAIAPHDATALAFRDSIAAREVRAIATAEALARSEPTAEHYLALAEVCYRSARYERCAAAAREAIRLNPGAADAVAILGAAERARRAGRE